MHSCLALTLLLISTTTARGLDTGNVMPPKPTTNYPASIPNPERQGGDTIADAVVIPSLPYSVSGTTAGYTNDYDEVCPYSGSSSPDIVYSYTPAGDEAVVIDLCGSSYDTKLYVYDADQNLVACNDDAYLHGDPCGVLVSALEFVPLHGGSPYSIVVDGYGGDFGDYVLNIQPFVPCVLECPAGGLLEGEPPLVDDYADEWNGGCGAPGHPFQELTADPAGNLILCGVSGWYSVNGSPRRDTDWFHIYMGESGAIEITADVECPTQVHERPQDCGVPEYNQSIIVGGCAGASMTCTWYSPGEVVWLAVAPTTFYAPAGYGNEYDYVLWFSGLEPGTIATESTTWGAVKALYR